MLLTGMRLQAQAAARRAGFTLVGLVFLFTGLVILSVAGWMVLEQVRDALFATTVVGGAYSGLGLIFLALASRRYTRVPVAAPHQAIPEPRFYTYAVPALIEAFMVGLSAGKSSRRPQGDER